LRRASSTEGLCTGATALRSLHTGHVGAYVMWLRIGLAAFGGLVIVAVP